MLPCGRHDAKEFYSFLASLCVFIPPPKKKKILSWFLVPFSLAMCLLLLWQEQEKSTQPNKIKKSLQWRSLHFAVVLTLNWWLLVCMGSFSGRIHNKKKKNKKKTTDTHTEVHTHRDTTDHNPLPRTHRFLLFPSSTGERNAYLRLFLCPSF